MKDCAYAAYNTYSTFSRVSNGVRLHIQRATCYTTDIDPAQIGQWLSQNGWRPLPSGNLWNRYIVIKYGGLTVGTERAVDMEWDSQSTLILMAHELYISVNNSGPFLVLDVSQGRRGPAMIDD
jgi:hypothetical protein